MAESRDLQQAVDYYRHQADAIGTRLLQTQAELIEARRDARRQRAIARIVRGLYAAAEAHGAPERMTAAAEAELGDRLLAMLVDSLQIECAALLAAAPPLGMLQVEQALGLEPGFTLPPLDTLAQRASSGADHLVPIPVRVALRSAGLHAWLWLASARAGCMLLLGQRCAPLPGALVAFDATDCAIPEAAFEVYLGLLEQRRAARALHAAEIDYRTLFESAQDGFAVIDGQRRQLLDANRRAQILLGCPLEELRQRPLTDWLADPQEALWSRLWRRALAGCPQQLECRLRVADGHVFWAEIHLTRIGAKSSGRLLLVGRDIAERKRDEEKLRQYAFRDELTQLPNRALMFGRLEEAIQHQRQEPRYLFALLFLDIDRFKVVNDSLGHSLGDRLLIAIGQRLRACLGDHDTIARLGGDEFLILLADLPHPAAATASARRLEQSLHAPFTVNGHEIFTSASIGIVLADGRYSQPEAMLRDADIAMYQAKRRESRDQRYALFDPAMHARALANMELERDLRRALERDELQVHYQPIIDLTSGRIKGFEALARWFHPLRGQVSPGQFIPLAEETLLILDIGRFVLQAACRQAARWAARFDPPPKVNVNLSGRQFVSTLLARETGQLVSECGCPTALINLEITESAILADTDLARASLEQLHAQGFELSMDDFGTGYSSLSYLHQFPFDIIKVDRSFVAALGEGTRTATIVSAIVNLAKNLDKRIVAEGIETAAQLDLLRRLGCAYGQGYYFSPPVSAEAAAAMIDTPPWDPWETPAAD